MKRMIGRYDRERNERMIGGSEKVEK